MVADGGRILIDNRDMAKHGLAVGDIAVVTKALAEARPELVARYVQAECAAITFWHDHPEETAQIVERELGVDPQEAARTMRGTGVLRSAEHTSELQSLMRISYAVLSLQKKQNKTKQ